MRYFFTVLACLALLSAQAQIKEGDTFPQISGENLNDAAIDIPATNGKETIVLIAYTADAQKGSKLWAKELYANFIDPNSMSSGLYDVNVYYVYLFGGIKKAAFGKIKKRVKPETDADLYDHVVLAETSSGFYKEELAFKDKNQPNIFLINEYGKIAWHGYGRYTSQKLDKLMDAIGGE